MIIYKSRFVIRLLLLAFLAVSSSVTQAQVEGFVKRNIDHLYIDTNGNGIQDSNEPDYRMIGFNSTRLALQTDANPSTNGGSKCRWGDPVEYQMAMNDIKQLGANIFHGGGLTVVGANKKMGTIPPSYSFVTGIRQYNEDAFRHWDQLIQIASQNGVRVVIRVLSSFGVNGGKENFCALRGLPESAFF